MKIGLQVTRYIIDHCMQGASSIKFGTYFLKKKLWKCPIFGLSHHSSEDNKFFSKDHPVKLIFFLLVSHILSTSNWSVLLTHMKIVPIKRHFQRHQYIFLLESDFQWRIWVPGHTLAYLISRHMILFSQFFPFEFWNCGQIGPKWRIQSIRAALCVCGSPGRT